LSKYRATIFPTQNELRELETLCLPLRLLFFCF